MTYADLQFWTHLSIFSLLCLTKTHRQADFFLVRKNGPKILYISTIAVFEPYTKFHNSSMLHSGVDMFTTYRSDISHTCLQLHLYLKYLEYSHSNNGVSKGPIFQRVSRICGLMY